MDETSDAVTARLVDNPADDFYDAAGGVERRGASLDGSATSGPGMPGTWLTRLAVVLYGVNAVAIVTAIASGHRKGDIAMRFQERQTITYFSSNQLAMTALLAATIYLLRRHVLGRDVRATLFWLLSSVAFFFLMLDESFQFHEGMDSRVVDLVAPGAKNPRVDGLSTAAYGLGALAVCWFFRQDVLRWRPTFRFFCVGGVFLAATSALNIGNAPPWRVVAEEACKLLGVASFFLGYFAAFLGTVTEARAHAAVPVARPSVDSHLNAQPEHPPL